MLYLIIAIVCCWIVAVLLLRASGNSKPMLRLKEAKERMDNAPNAGDRTLAAKEVVAIIEQYELAGVVADDALRDAEAVIRASFSTR
jgi:hypothetical protein